MGKTCVDCMMSYLCVIRANVLECIWDLPMVPISDDSEKGMHKLEARVQTLLAEDCPFYILEEEGGLQ
jgi:hypothetical protein